MADCDRLLAGLTLLALPTGPLFAAVRLIAIISLFTSLAALAEYLRFVTLPWRVLQAWPHPPE
jgi:hypothetical protein